MEVFTSENGNQITITLKGELSIIDVSSLHEVLLDYLQRFDNVSLDLEGITDIDFACLQLIYSAYKYSEKNHKKFEISKISDIIGEKSMQVGFKAEILRIYNAN
jgi:anti-anti-sigma factor